MILPFLLFWLLLTGTWPPAADAYSVGAPTDACNSMTPSHGSFSAQDSSPPYSITPNSTRVTHGGRVLVRLQKASSEPFKGFLIQGRSSQDGSIIGTFFTANHKTVICDKGFNNAVTHGNKEFKSEVTLEWQPPSDFEGDIVFRATVVQGYQVFWTNLQSEKVSVVKRDVSVANVGPIPKTEDSEESTTATTTQEPIKGLQKAITDIYFGCGTIKTCLGLPEGCVDKKNCKTMTTFTKANEEEYEFEALGPAVSGNDRYVAVALSYDSKMGNDSVVACSAVGGSVDVYNSWNSGYSNSPVADKYGDLTILEKGVMDDKIFCRFLRKSKTRHNNQNFDLNNEKYFVLLASGTPKTDGKIQYHGRPNRLASPSSVHLGLTSKPVYSSMLPFEDLHAALMIIAWVGTASCGMLMARYFKKTWLNYKCMNIDQWFHLHRFFMILTWGLSIAGLVLIVLKVKDFRMIPHAYVGIVSVGLCFLQPFMAMCRCAPTAKRRPIFNWLHWLVGNSAQALGIAAIFLGMELKFGNSDRDWLKEVMWYILIVYIGFHCLVHFMLSIAQCISDRKDSKSSNDVFPLKDLSDSRTPLQMEKVRQDASGGCFRKFILGLYLPINWIATFLLVVCVLIKKEDIEDQFKEWEIPRFWEES